MSKNTKIILGIVAGLVILCMCVCLGSWAALKIGGNSLVKTMAKSDPVEAAAMAHEMIDYNLPPGYQENLALNFWVAKMVIISKGGEVTNDPSRTMIMVAEFPSSLEMNEEDMRNQLQQQMGQTTGERNWKMELVEQKAAVIRGQDVTLMIYKGTDENGVEVKQMVSSLFAGKNGDIMLWIGGAEAGWDQYAIDTFIGSIR
jgi:hypothetical protein